MHWADWHVVFEWVAPSGGVIEDEGHCAAFEGKLRDPPPSQPVNSGARTSLDLTEVCIERAFWRPGDGPLESDAGAVRQGVGTCRVVNDEENCGCYGNEEGTRYDEPERRTPS